MPVVCSISPEADKDLLNTGVILHDIGKIKEYQYDTNIDVADEGRFLGHIILGIEMVNKKIAEIDDFPEELRLKLLHMIASHHGRYEWQSPKIPVFLEACLLHHLDLLDGEAYKFINVNKDSRTWSKTLERWVYTPVEQDEGDIDEGDVLLIPPF